MRFHSLRFKVLLGILGVVAAAGTFGMSAQTPAELASPKLRIDWAEFKKLYDEKKIEVVDVRDAESYEAGHIQGSRSVPLDEIENRVAELKKLSKPIVTYCS